MKSNTVRLLGFISLLNVALGVCWGPAGGGGVEGDGGEVGWVCVCTFYYSFTIKQPFTEFKTTMEGSSLPPPNLGVSGKWVVFIVITCVPVFCLHSFINSISANIY